MTRDPEETREKSKIREKTIKFPSICVGSKQRMMQMPCLQTKRKSQHRKPWHSISHLGAKPGSKAMDISLSAFASLPSLAEAKDLSDKKTSSSLSQEDSEDSGNLSDGSEEVTPISRPLSPSQYFGSLMKPSGSRKNLFDCISGNCIAGKRGLYLSFSFQNSSLATGCNNG
jgi:hypothetical protein